MARSGVKGAKAPALEYFEVRFAEVEAVLDLSEDARLAADGEGSLDVAYPFPGLAGRTEHLDGRGRQVYTERDSGGPIAVVDFRRGSQVRRTFDRERSAAIDGKWVYVFRAEDPEGRGAELVAELSFRKGKYRRANRKDREADPWKSGGRETEVLLLERALVGAAARPHAYFFHLSPFRLSEQALGRVLKEIGARGVSLADPFHVDFYLNGEHDQATSPLVLKLRSGKMPEERVRGYRIHLVDAAKEGLRRAHRYTAALDAWEGAQRALSADPEYLLAKRIQLVTSGAENLRSLVVRRLHEYLGPAEKDSSRCFWVAHLTLADLIAWIGEEQRAGTRRASNGELAHVYFQEGRRAAYWRGAGQPAWTNAFSRAMRDAHDAEPEVARCAFWDTLAVVHHRVKELETGREWLFRNLGRALDDRDPGADAGAALVFQAQRKAVQAIPEGLGWLLEAYGEAWTRRHREDALSSLALWMRLNYGVDAGVGNRAERRAFQSAARRELRRARRKGIDALELASPTDQKVRMAKGAFESLHFGIETVNLAVAVQALRESPKDGWAWIEATGAVLDGYDALGKLAPSVPSIEVRLTGRLVGLKAFLPLAAVAGAIDVAGGIRGGLKATEGGERFGHGMVTGGALLALAGAFAATGPVALGIVALGVALQAAGQLLASAYGPLQRMLRNSRFGDGGGWRGKTADLLDPTVDEPWYEGKKLSALGADIPGQLQALDQILYGFEVRVRTAGSRVQLELELKLPSQITDVARWRIDATVIKDGVPQKVPIDDAALWGSPEDKATKFISLTDVDPPSFRSPSSRYVPVRKVEVKGEVTLLVQGEGKPEIKRKFESEFRLDS